MNDRSIPRSLIILGVCMGIVHLFWSVATLFVFKEGEPLTSWIAVMAGPVLTMPAFIISFLVHRIGGSLLIAGGITSFVALVIGYGLSVEVIYFGLLISVPMLILGRGFFTLKNSTAIRAQ